MLSSVGSPERSRTWKGSRKKATRLRTVTMISMMLDLPTTRPPRWCGHVGSGSFKLSILGRCGPRALNLRISAVSGLPSIASFQVTISLERKALSASKRCCNWTICDAHFMRSPERCRGIFAGPRLPWPQQQSCAPEDFTTSEAPAQSDSPPKPMALQLRSVRRVPKSSRPTCSISGGRTSGRL